MSNDLLNRLLAAGTDPALVVEVAAELGRLQGMVEAGGLKPEAIDTAAENRRTWDRIYRANKRAAEKLAKSCPPDIHPTQVESADIADTDPSPASPNDNNLTPSTHTPENKSRGRTKPGHRLAADWRPVLPYPDSVAALVTLWPPGREARELEGFCDYWLTRSRDASRTDWDRTWWNRIRDRHDTIIRESRYDHRPRNDRPAARGLLGAVLDAERSGDPRSLA